MPAEMLRFVRDLDRARALARASAEAEIAHDKLTARRRSRCEAIARALDALGEGAAAPSDDASGEQSMAEAIDRAQEVFGRVSELANEVDRARGAAASAVETLALREREAAARRRVLAEWTSEWTAATAAMQLSVEVTPAEAQAELEALGDLWNRQRGLDELRRRIEGIDRDRAALEQESATLAARHLPEVAALPLSERVDALVGRHGSAKAAARRRAQLDAKIEEKRTELGVVRARHDDAQALLDGQMRAHGAGNVEGLRALEVEAREGARLDQRITQLEEDLLGLGDGEGIEALREQIREVDPDEASARLAELDTLVQEADQEHQQKRTELGAAREALKQLEAASAVESTEAMEQALAALCAPVDRYVQLRLAAALLRREIERYRDENQGPILSRAAALFPRLTLGHYGSLRAGYDGSGHVLVCERSDGSECHVEGLSDGTRDQLYLALRVASLERHAAHHEPMPVVLDDVLVHFDDARAKAALEVLGELGRSTQVLLFTHHARVRELAHEALGEGLRVHALDVVSSP